MTDRRWRLLDTGLRNAAENIALNRALLEARQANEAPNTLRFLQFTPSALLGFHQSAEQELNLDYCAEHGVAIQRRITGGGAIYMDQTQLGWELYLDKNELGTADMQAISRRICEAAARGISTLGVAAQYRPRNDIEVDGRKISGTGGAFDGDALMFQGTMLIRFDIEKMLRVLRIPAEKLSDKAINSARERIANLSDLLARDVGLDEVKTALARTFADEFSVVLEPAGLSPAEQRRFDQALAEISAPDWIHMATRPQSERPMLEGMQKFAGGLLRAGVILDPAAERIKQIWLTGDVFIQPKRTLADLEAVLRDTRIDQLESNVAQFFAVRQVDMLGLTAHDFVTLIQHAIAPQPIEEGSTS